MATAAQIEANRRNAARSTGPRTPMGKDRSRFNALDHGCRAQILVLPIEEFGEFEARVQAWKASFRPRTPVEEFLIEGILRYQCQVDRIRQAHTARLARRINHGEIEEADRDQEQALALGERLFRDPSPPPADDSDRDRGKSRRRSKASRAADDDLDTMSPARLVLRMETTGAGCDWLLDQWSKLRAVLERGAPWVGPDQYKAIRLLGANPADAVTELEVAQVYLAGHLLRGEEGNPFQDVFEAVGPEKAPGYERFFTHRDYETIAQKDAAAARQFLLDQVDRAIERLLEKAEALRAVAELNAPYLSARLSWDDTPEGERLRRYELTCDRAHHRMLDLLLKIRRTREELDIATVQSVFRSIPTVTFAASDEPAPMAATATTAPPQDPEPSAPPNEANSAGDRAPNEPNRAGDRAPNEANSRVEAPAQERANGGQGFRIDAPHLDFKPSGAGKPGKQRINPALERALGGGRSPLLDLSPIFGER